MKLYNCQTPHNPPHSYGDCVRACVATLMQDENVPHVFGNHNNETSWKKLREYIGLKGKKLALFPLDSDPFTFMGETNAGVQYILMGFNGSANHAVVCCGSKVLHNPSTSAIPNKPTEFGVWIVGVIL